MKLRNLPSAILNEKKYLGLLNLTINVVLHFALLKAE